MKSAIQLTVCTAYFLAVALVTFGAFWLVAAPFIAMQNDFGATVMISWLIACITAGGILGMRGFKRILPLID